VRELDGVEVAIRSRTGAGGHRGEIERELLIDERELESQSGDRSLESLIVERVVHKSASPSVEHSADGDDCLRRCNERGRK